ncbi:MAG: radical SAM protein [bacterium]|nr:radical SAM protein [bacterium]
MKKQVNVLLVSPGFSSPRSYTFGDPHLVALGSALQEWTRAEVTLFDLDYESLLPNPDNSILFDKGFHLVGISCYSSFDYLKSYYIGEEIRKRNPSACLVVGGYHPSARPGDFCEDGSPFDHVVVGEGELPLTRIVKAMERGERLEEQVLGPEAVPDLNDLPPMDWHLLDRYLPTAARLGKEVALSLSRGCVFNCSFCMEAAKGPRTWRPYTPQRAQEEILRFHRWIDLKDRKLFVSDPLFGFQREWRLEMLERFEKMALPVNAVWALSRADILEDEDLDYFYRARFGLGFGLESGDPGMLKIIHKGGDVNKYLERFMRLAQRAAEVGMPWGANIITGHPGETPESMERSAAWMQKLFSETTPLTGFLAVDPYLFYPGSPIAVNLEHYEKQYGTCVYRSRWWNFTEPEFTSRWIDPSRTLDFRTRETLTARLFLPVLQTIAKRYSYDGYAADYFGKPPQAQLDEHHPRKRVKTITNHYLWRGLTGEQPGRVTDDEEVVGLLAEARSHTVDGIAQKFGEIPQALDEAVRRIPREQFTDEAYLWESTRDRTIPLLEDSTSTVSAIHAYVVNYRILELKEGDRFLELGGGTGYGAAIAALLVGKKGNVRSVEIEKKLATRAEENLKTYSQVEVIGGEVDLKEQLREGFNKILYCYAVDGLPDVGELLLLNGRMLVPLRTGNGEQQLTLVEKTETGVHITKCGAVLYVSDKSKNPSHNQQTK